jgi:hypothetical protein
VARAGLGNGGGVRGSKLSDNGSRPKCPTSNSGYFAPRSWPGHVRSRQYRFYGGGRYLSLSTERRRSCRHYSSQPLSDRCAERTGAGSARAQAGHAEPSAGLQTPPAPCASSAPEFAERQPCSRQRSRLFDSSSSSWHCTAAVQRGRLAPRRSLSTTSWQFRKCHLSIVDR